MARSAPIPSNIYPSLTYDDAPAAIEWLCRAFGFEKRLVVPADNGKIMHSELTLGPGVIMVSSPKAEYRRVSPRGLPGSPLMLSVRIADPDEHCARAKEAGGVILREVQDEPYGSRGYMVEDPGGHTWYFGTYSPGSYWDGAG